MTDPREDDVYRQPNTGEEVLIDLVRDAEVYVRVTDGRGGLTAARRVTLVQWRAIRELHGLQLTHREPIYEETES